MAAMSDDPVTLEVSRLIKSVADRYGEQARFARAVGTSGTAVSTWKLLKSRPEPERWAAIEQYFGLPAGHLRSIERRGKLTKSMLDARRAQADKEPVPPKSGVSPLPADLDARLDRLADGLEQQEQRRQQTIRLVYALAEQLGVDPNSLPHVD